MAGPPVMGVVPRFGSAVTNAGRAPEGRVASCTLGLTFAMTCVHAPADVVQLPAVVTTWTPPVVNGVSLPHGIGWFVQSYNGEPIVWQFGESGASSSLMIVAPRRSTTLFLLANSAGLSQGLNLSAGDLNVSPFARVFLSLFVR